MNIIKRATRRLLKRQKVAAVMIVKNEEARLARCLASLKGEVDQIIISDTGSTDDSIKIAKSFGATVIPGIWRNDFSEARNQAFVLAQEYGVDWALIIDADEWIEPVQSLLDLANTPSSNSLYYFPLRNQMRWKKLDGEWAFSWFWQPRFARMAAIPYYQRGIHNKMGLLRCKFWDRRVDYVLKHDGYAMKQGELNQKLVKRLPQVDNLIKQGQEPGPMLFDKVRYLASAGQDEQAEKLLKQSEAEFAKHGEYTIAMANMEGILASNRHDFDRVIQLLYRCHELNPNYMDAEFHLAYAWLMRPQPNFKRAARYLRSHKLRCDDFWKAPQDWICNEELVTVDANEVGWMILEHKKKERGQ